MCIETNIFIIIKPERTYMIKYMQNFLHFNIVLGNVSCYIAWILSSLGESRKDRLVIIYINSTCYKQIDKSYRLTYISYMLLQIINFF